MKRYDVIIIGTGISGMYQLHAARELGLSAHAFEAGSDVGGTWYWNRYPGARFDSESYCYQYSFSKELLKEWNWSEQFSSQPEIHAYLKFVAEKLDLRKDIDFNARVKSATYDEDANEWEVRTHDGRAARSTFMVTCLGSLSAPVVPNIPDRQLFRGQSFHTTDWPKDPVDFSTKRVAVIGTGATGVQVIQELAKLAKHLTVLQKQPEWVKPLRNAKIAPEEMEKIKSAYPDMFARCKTTPAAFIYDWDPRNMAELPEAEREPFLEALYQQPGFRFWFSNFKDLSTNAETAKFVSDFLAKKIRERVKNPKTAEMLIPKNHPFGTRRVPMERDYLEAYNRDNVDLIDINVDKIERFTPNGLIVAGKEIPLDVVVFATGFDAVRGSFDRIDIRGRNGLALKDKWANGPSTYMGTQIHGFPNLLTVVGPHNASTYCNMPRCIEQNVEFVTALIGHLRKHGHNYVEASEKAEKEWTEWNLQNAETMLFSKVQSWFTGMNENVEGRKRQILVYTAGLPYFLEYCKGVIDEGYRGYIMKDKGVRAAVGAN